MAEKTFTLDTGDGKRAASRSRGHVERITTLAGEGFYDGVVFHLCRQGGDPTGISQGRIQQRTAQTRMDSANSQFFICFDDAEFLDGQYTVWGQVESGMDHIDALPKGEPPANPGKIVKATVG